MNASTTTVRAAADKLGLPLSTVLLLVRCGDLGFVLADDRVFAITIPTLEAYERRLRARRRRPPRRNADAAFPAVSVDVVAELLGVSEATVLHHVDVGDLDATESGGTLHVSLHSLDRLDLIGSSSGPLIDVAAAEVARSPQPRQHPELVGAPGR